MPTIPLQWHMANRHGELNGFRFKLVSHREYKGLKRAVYKLKLSSLELWPTSFVLKH